MLWVKIRIGRRPRTVGGIHFVPSAAIRGNREARELHHRQERGAARWLARQPRLALLLGDTNAERGQGLLTNLHGVGAGYTDRRGTRGPRAIDWAFVKLGKALDRIRARGMRVEVRALHGYSSDHRPLRVTIRRRPRRKARR